MNIIWWDSVICYSFFCQIFLVIKHQKRNSAFSPLGTYLGKQEGERITKAKLFPLDSFPRYGGKWFLVSDEGRLRHSQQEKCPAHLVQLLIRFGPISWHLSLWQWVGGHRDRAFFTKKCHLKATVNYILNFPPGLGTMDGHLTLIMYPAKSSYTWL